MTWDVMARNLSQLSDPLPSRFLSLYLPAERRIYLLGVLGALPWQMANIYPRCLKCKTRFPCLANTLLCHVRKLIQASLNILSRLSNSLIWSSHMSTHSHIQRCHSPPDQDVESLKMIMSSKGEAPETGNETPNLFSSIILHNHFLFSVCLYASHRAWL